jgi:hypothetical protein
MDSIVDRHSRETTRTPMHTPRRWRERGHRPKKKRSEMDTPWPLPSSRGKRISTGGSVTSDVKIGIGTWARSDYRPSRSVPVGSTYLPTSLRKRTYVYPPSQTHTHINTTQVYTHMYPAYTKTSRGYQFSRTSRHIANVSSATKTASKAIMYDLRFTMYHTIHIRLFFFNQLADGGLSV